MTPMKKVTGTVWEDPNSMMLIEMNSLLRLTYTRIETSITKEICKKRNPVLGVLVFLPRSWIILDNLEFFAKILDVFETFYLFVFFSVPVIWVIFWLQEDVTETSTAFLEKRRIRKMQFLLDLGFWHSVEEAWTRLFLTQSRFICIPEKDRKKSNIVTEEVWTIIFVQICLISASILFQFIFASFFLVRPSWGSDKSTRKSSPFLSYQG